MKQHSFPCKRTVLATLVWGTVCALGSGAQERPNFVLIFADDLGYQDIKA